MKIDYDQASDRSKIASIGLLWQSPHGPLHAGVAHQGARAQGG